MSVLFAGRGSCSEVTSPRLRGEVAPNARVRGEPPRGRCRHCTHHPDRPRGEPPSPQPSQRERSSSRPRKRGEGEDLPQLSQFATLSASHLSFGTTLERIAAESLTPPGFPLRSRNMSRDACGLRTRSSLAGADKRTHSLKLGTARSRIRIAKESNGFRPAPHPEGPLKAGVSKDEGPALSAPCGNSGASPFETRAKSALLRVRGKSGAPSISFPKNNPMHSSRAQVFQWVIPPSPGG